MEQVRKLTKNPYVRWGLAELWSFIQVLCLSPLISDALGDTLGEDHDYALPTVLAFLMSAISYTYYTLPVVPATLVEEGVRENLNVQQYEREAKGEVMPKSVKLARNLFCFPFSAGASNLTYITVSEFAPNSLSSAGLKALSSTAGFVANIVSQLIFNEIGDCCCPNYIKRMVLNCLTKTQSAGEKCFESPPFNILGKSLGMAFDAAVAAGVAHTIVRMSASIITHQNDSELHDIPWGNVALTSVACIILTIDDAISGDTTLKMKYLFAHNLAGGVMQLAAYKWTDDSNLTEYTPQWELQYLVTLGCVLAAPRYASYLSEQLESFPHFRRMLQLGKDFIVKNGLFITLAGMAIAPTHTLFRSLLLSTDLDKYSLCIPISAFIYKASKAAIPREPIGPGTYNPIYYRTYPSADFNRFFSCKTAKKLAYGCLVAVCVALNILTFAPVAPAILSKELINLKDFDPGIYAFGFLVAYFLHNQAISTYRHIYPRAVEEAATPLEQPPLNCSQKIQQQLKKFPAVSFLLINAYCNGKVFMEQATGGAQNIASFLAVSMFALNIYTTTESTAKFKIQSLAVKAVTSFLILGVFSLGISNPFAYSDDDAILAGLFLSSTILSEFLESRFRKHTTCYKPVTQDESVPLLRY